MEPSSGPIRFYFDYISTNAYLAWHVLAPMAQRYGRSVEPIPVLFAGLLGASGQLGPAEVPPKAWWMWKNNVRKAALLGMPLKPPAFHPFNPLLALRVSSLPLEAESRSRLITALFDAVWVDGQHVSEANVVASIADTLGLAGGELVAAAQQPEAKERLRQQTDAAIARQVFGVPSMMVGDEVFWGYDDLPYLDLHLAGKDPWDADAAARAMSQAPRPSARRRQVGGFDSTRDGG